MPQSTESLTPQLREAVLRIQSLEAERDHWKTAALRSDAKLVALREILQQAVEHIG